MPDNEDQEPIIQDDATTFQFETTGDPRQKLTIDELYDHAGFKLLSFNTTAAAGMGFFMFGTLLMYVQLICQYMLCQEEMTDIEVVAVKVIVILGFIMGEDY